ncbi:YHYH protein [Yoonia tamlensis]|uniref:YHYH protein n=1 Tax=Yoonia tamlensis TaxID=390270 RepID=A0A1I6GS08_9RHOB|nr:YHYH protein [Yoonia tamlensis]SFR44994.1 YHYH protein [Yoonia tamlensis]
MNIALHRDTKTLKTGAGLLLISACVGIGGATAAQAHDDHCAAIAGSVVDAGFADSVTVTCSDTHATIRSDTYPDHDLMTGITGTNEQVPVPADYAAPVILVPELGDTPLTRDAALGVAVNGVPIYDYTGGGEMSQTDLAHHQAQHDTVQTGQLDICGGHAGRGDDYHYHAAPVCMIAQMDNAGPNAVIGWAFDGFPIYGDTNPDGSVIADGVLDVCNGQPDVQFGYRYHTSQDAPYIVQCLMGVVADFDALPRVAPLVAAAGGGATPGRPPQGGVEGLVYSEDENGQRRMDYRYAGEDYYIRYAPAATQGCYDFETKTVTNAGALQSGEYCR